MTPTLQIQELSVSYGALQAVDAISLDLPNGGLVAVLGANGAGKSSLLNAAMGLVPSRGKVLLDGEDISALPPEERLARGLCLVPEQRFLFGAMTVEENLELGAWRRGRSSRHGRINEIYALLPHLAERRDQTARTMSGGERQMLAIGRALMARPTVLMLDEPSLGLAPLIVRDILALVSDLRSEGLSVLLVEQNAKAALKIADTGLVVELGRVSMQGKATDLATDQGVIATYLGGVGK